MNNRQATVIAGLLGFAGVFFGAFGAHMLREMLTRLGTSEFWHTAVFYHLVHAVVLLVLSGWRPVPRFAYYAILLGVIFFSGSLYALALTNLKWIALITPLGGFGMLFGWLGLVFRKADH
jgi:uncharacterized membrane protein YgdD (TMEM256/DUF423 family)